MEGSVASKSDLAVQLSEIKSAVEYGASRQDRVEGRLQGVEGRLERVEDTVHKQGIRQEVFQDTLNAVLDNVLYIRERMSEFEKAISKIDNHEHRISALEFHARQG